METAKDINQEQEEKILTRRIPVEGPFMNYDSDDILYGIMYAYSTYEPNKKILYLSKRNFAIKKKTIYSACGISSKAMFDRHMAKLIEKGLIKEEKNVYYFLQNKDEKYRIIHRDLLEYLSKTRPKHFIRVYILLLDWYLWKKKENSEFIFTNKLIMEKLGYSKANKKVSADITAILHSLAREGYIEYEEFYDVRISPEGKELPVPQMRLKKVAQSESELNEIHHKEKAEKN